MKESFNRLYWKIIFCLLLFLTFKSNVRADIIFNRGETFISNVSPYLLQNEEKDSLQIKQYKKIKNLYEKGKYSQSLDLGLKLLEEIKKDRKNIELEYLCNFLIGEIFGKINNYDKALLYYKKSLSLLRQNSKLLDRDGKIYSNTDLLNSLLKIGGQYQKLKKKDSALFYYNKVIEDNNIGENKKALFIKAGTYTNLSIIYREDSVYNKARFYASKSIEIYKKINDKIFEAVAMNNLGDIYTVEKKFKKAKDIYFKALELIEKDQSTTAVKYKEALYYNLAYALFKLKDYTAYEYQEKSYIIQDGLRDKEMRRIVEEIYTNHKVDIERQKANLAKSQVELKKLQERKVTLLLSALSLLVLIISGVVIYNYKLRQKNLELKFSKSELIQQQNIEKLKSESQIKILNATLDGKESERKQIAETLHDSVSSLLSSATLHLQATRTQFNGGTPIEIDKTQAIITEASEKIRDLSHTLVSSVLLKFGLRHAIKDIAEKYSNSAIQIHTDISDIRRYHQGFEIKANNIIQEFINNILKHSKAKNAFISMQEKEEALYVTIEDDGQGFDPKEITNKDGLGINQIEARIKMMKGSLKINSTLGKGTIIKMVLPIVEKEKVSFNLA